MRLLFKIPRWLLGPALLLVLAAAPNADAQQLPPSTFVAPNSTGQYATFSGANQSGQIDFNNPFFQQIGRQFGSNGNNRSCSTCHRPDDGWTITAARAQGIFNATGGLDPLFARVDGTNAPNSNISTLDARRRASSLLLSKGVIRIPLSIRAGSEFRLTAVAVPQNGSFPGDFAANALNTQTLSLFRRPPPTGNASFLTDVMLDGRETNLNRSLFQTLVAQAQGATRAHLQGAVPANLSAQQLAIFQSIANFELNLFGAQIRDNGAALLDANGAIGGPVPLFSPPPQFFQGGIFNLFQPWSQLAPTSDPVVQTRLSVARGEALFNSRIFNTGGLVGQATCSTCHSVRGAGNSTTRRRFNLGLSNPGLIIGGVRVNSVLPIYTLRRNSDGRTVRTTDPGRILITGRWVAPDGDAFKVPVLRGVVTRAPYFHGGQAQTLTDVVRFYNGRFAIGLTLQQQQDLVNFLRSL